MRARSTTALVAGVCMIIACGCSGSSEAARTVVDAHVHFASLSRFAYDGEWVHTSHGLGDYVDDIGVGGGGCSGLGEVTKVVAVQASVGVNQSAEEAAFFAGINDQRTAAVTPLPEVAAIVGYAPLERGGAATVAAVAALRQRSRGLLRGIRRIFELAPPVDDDATTLPQPPALASPCWFNEGPARERFLDGLRVLADNDLHFEALTRNSSQFACAAALLRDAPPHLVVILDHLGGPDMTNPSHLEFAAWTHYLNTLVPARPNLYVKVSGVPERAVGAARTWNDWSFQQVEPYLNAVIDTAGWSRVIYGGNWFVVTMYGTYKGWTDVLAEAVRARGAGEKEVEALMWGNAHRAYRL